MTDLWLIYSNEHRAFWGPGRMGYVTDMDRAGRYSEAEATEIVLNANRYQKFDVPPNEVMVLAPIPRAASMTDEDVVAAALSDPDNPPTSDDALVRMTHLSELTDQEFSAAFDRAIARYDDMPRIICTSEQPWDGVPRPGTMVLHPAAREVSGVRRCPYCGFQWETEQ